jgi:hypothetical protein
VASQKSGVAQACAKGSIFLGVFFFVSFFWTSKRKKSKYLHPFGDATLSNNDKPGRPQTRSMSHTKSISRASIVKNILFANSTIFKSRHVS